MPRIINGQYFEDGKPGTRIINTEGGNYTEKIEGDFIQGNVIGSTPKPAPQRKDLSKDGDAVDVEAVTEDEEKSGLAKFVKLFKKLAE
ncbi:MULTISPECIES: hypothetical protein [unclassified Microcoleus]|uniref:hypothetical protein n=1 Tax=unclassified Microcoleus TaxID=2642155 RepID=UPI002FD56738